MKVKKPSLIFTGSSGEMWGDWVDSEWIGDVLDVCNVFAPWHTYQFLTKNPKRYAEFTLPKNGWYGTTYDGTEKTRDNILLLRSTVPDGFIRFVSFEPLLASAVVPLEGFDWIIIGADSTRGAKKPPKEWADTLINQARNRNIPVFIKDNYGYPGRIKQMPNNL